MAKDTRDLLAVLKAELEFLEKGGYRYTARAEWRPHFIFQDSPACINFDPAQPQKPCSDCALIQLVPGDSTLKKVPCRYIPLNERGETIDYFYRFGTEAELESAVRQWLNAEIQRLEKERTASNSVGIPAEIHVRAKASHAE